MPGFPQEPDWAGPCSRTGTQAVLPLCSGCEQSCMCSILEPGPPASATNSATRTPRCPLVEDSTVGPSSPLHGKTWELHPVVSSVGISDIHKTGSEI